MAGQIPPGLKELVWQIWQTPAIQPFFSGPDVILTRLGYQNQMPSISVPAALQGVISNDTTCEELLEKGKGRCTKPRTVGSPFCPYHTNRKKNDIQIALLSPAGRVVPCFDEKGIVLVPINQRILNETLAGLDVGGLPRPPLTPYVGGLPVYTEIGSRPSQRDDLAPNTLPISPPASPSPALGAGAGPGYPATPTQAATTPGSFHHPPNFLSPVASPAPMISPVATSGPGPSLTSPVAAYGQITINRLIASPPNQVAIANNVKG